MVSSSSPTPSVLDNLLNLSIDSSCPDDNNHPEDESHPPSPSMATVKDRLRYCVQQSHIKDMDLVGSDGIKVPALRCVLGSASPVLERMLYGEFAESNASIIDLSRDGCTSKALTALVEFCCTDELNTTVWVDDRLEDMVADAMALANLGHSYELTALQDHVQAFLLPHMAHDPSMACLVINHAHPLPTPNLYRAALEMIQTQPYVALIPNEETKTGGFACLFPDKLEEVAHDPDIEAEELFLFQRLLEWKEHNQDTYENVHEICQRVAQRFRFTCMDPRDLRTIVRTSGLVNDQHLLEAFMAQACTAADEGVTFAAFRGSQQRGHVLVEGAGVPGCNGIYTECRDVSNPSSLLYYTKPDQQNNSTYYLIKDRLNSWKICENTAALYEWKSDSQSARQDHYPRSGWTLPSSTNGSLPLASKGKLPVPRCKWFRARDSKIVEAAAVTEGNDAAPMIVSP